jgi:hypothetical protein
MGIGLPSGFQPRACQFCGSRHLHNRPEKDDPLKFRVECLFCHSLGPAGEDNDDAWIRWSGGGPQASPMFGSVREVIA